MRLALLFGLGWQSIGDGGCPRQQVEVNADESLRRLTSHRVRHGGADVASLRDVARVAEALHQYRPCVGDAAGPGFATRLAYARLSFGKLSELLLTRPIVIPSLLLGITRVLAFQLFRSP